MVGRIIQDMLHHGNFNLDNINKYILMYLLFLIINIILNTKQY